MFATKSEKEIELIRNSSKIVAEVLKLIGSKIQVGVTTLELDLIAEDFIRSCGAEPAFKGYGHDKNNLYPASICASVNDEVVHGIPRNLKLCDGDIISVDVGVKLKGYFGDGAETFAVGKISDEKEKLMAATKASLEKGVSVAVAGNTIGDIGFAVQSFIEAKGFSVVRDLVGHGVGKELHEEPSIPNYGRPRQGFTLKEGMTLAIEPMVNAGSFKVKTDDDGWTVRTSDGKPSAHFEHTIVVRKNKVEILTII